MRPARRLTGASRCCAGQKRSTPCRNPTNKGGFCPYQRPDHNHCGSRGANKARQHGPQQKHASVPNGRSVEIAAHHDAAGYHIEREQERDEAHVIREHRIQKGINRCRRSERSRDRDEHEGRPASCDLAVMARPDSRRDQRPDSDREQNSNERQAPWPRQQRSAEKRCGENRRRHENTASRQCNSRS